MGGWNMQRGWWPTESVASREAATSSGKQERKCSTSKACSVLQESGKIQKLSSSNKRQARGRWTCLRP